MISKAKTVAAYLKELPPDRREAVTAVRKVILRNLPKGYREGMNWGMICYEVPLEVSGDTYNGQPLAYVALAGQKQYCSLYLTCSCTDDGKGPDPVEAMFKAAGKKLDRGKCCVRFKSAGDIPLEELGKLIRQTEVGEFVAQYKKARADYKAKKAGR